MEHNKCSYYNIINKFIYNNKITNSKQLYFNNFSTNSSLNSISFNSIDSTYFNNINSILNPNKSSSLKKSSYSMHPKYNLKQSEILEYFQGNTKCSNIIKNSAHTNNDYNCHFRKYPKFTKLLKMLIIAIISLLVKQSHSVKFRAN